MADDQNEKTQPLTQDQIAARARQIILEAASSLDQDNRPALTQEYTENLLQKALRLSKQSNTPQSEQEQSAEVIPPGSSKQAE
jgi:hypothetical protein